MTRLAFPSLKLAEWPEQDRRLWLEAREPAGLFGDAGIAAKWRPSTIANCEQSYGRWLAWLATEGELDSEQNPVMRVTRDRIGAFYESFSEGRADLTVAGTLRDIAYVLRACAPPHGVEWLTKLAHRLVNCAKPARPKLPRMARVVDIIAASERMMVEGLALIQRGSRKGLPLYRDGLMIGLLVRRPSLRRLNLASLQLGANFFVETGRARYSIPTRETKKGIALAEYVPGDLLDALHIYLDGVRSLLLKQGKSDHGWLWINRRGGRLDERDISVRVTRLTRKYLGVNLSPHLFRDCAATEIALEEPAHIGITKDVLGHANLASSQKFYNQATSFTAVARHAEVIRKLRADG